MLEIEQKYAQADFDAIRRHLSELGAERAPVRHEETDQYFNAPDRDFARTGEAFRLRSIGESNFLTFKGPKQKSTVKVRTELEIAIPPGAGAAQQHADLLVQLGYRPVARVHKRRETSTLSWRGFEVHICLDDVDELGRFAEVEVLAPPEQSERATEVLTEVARQLDLHEVEPRSYLTMLLAARAAKSPGTKEPIVVTTLEELRRQLAEVRRSRSSVGFVPTMGALHEGHTSLIRAARARNEVVVVSIFVNPAQFGPREDLSRYPRPFADDVRLCKETGVDLIYHPGVEEMYPVGFRTWVEVEGVTAGQEGASRPGHFRGVATVVAKLFVQVQPDRAYFGQKDAQQARMINQMVRDLDLPLEVVICPTIREADGLALSSRNRYLDPEQRSHAAVLYRALNRAVELHEKGERDRAVLEQAMIDLIASTSGARLDYAQVVDADSFQPAKDLDRPVLFTLAVRFGDTRLIDNMTSRIQSSATATLT